MPVTLRGTKGSALTHAELDANFSTLQADIAAVTGSNFNGDYNNLTNKPTVPQQLTDLSDVTVTPPTNGEVLQYNGSSFVNSTISYAEVTNTPVLATVATTGQLTALTDVATPTAGEDGYVLFYENATNSFKWKAAGSGGGGGGLSNVVNDTTPQLGGDLDLNNNNITGTGNINITGTINTTGNINLADDDKIIFGDGDDLQVWHTGADSIIQNSTGELQLRGNTIRLLNAATTKDYAYFNNNGSVDLYYDGTKKLETTADGVEVAGKILYGNVYSNLVDLPDANTYHGMFAHVHATGAGYFAHGGNWIQLANYTDLSPYQTVGTLGTNIDLHLNQSNPTAGYVLTWNGTDYAWTLNGTGTGLGDVVDDTTPQLGGDLDVNGKIITAASLNVALNPPVGGLLHLGLGTADAHSVMMYDLYKFPKATPNTGDVLTAGTNPDELEWSAPAGGGATNVASLIDVDSVDTVASGDFLLYDGSSSEYKFVAFQDEVNLLIDNRTGSSGHIATQSQYAGTITTDPADPTDTLHHVLGNTGSPSVHTASTAWYYGDVVSDPANPTTSVLLDVDQQRFTGNIQTTNISLGSPGSFNCQPGATLDLQGTTIHFGSASIAGGSAFNDTIDNHIWAGGTAPTDGYVLSWDASALSGAGDYSWIAPSGGSSYDQSLNTTDNVQFDSVTTDTINPLADSVNANGTNISIKAGEATALNSTGGFVNINGGAGALQDGDVYIAQSLPSGLGNNLVMGNGTNDALLNFNNITISGSPTFSNNVTMAAGVQERYVPLVGQGPGNVPYDAAFGQVMIHDTPTADHVADIVNLLISPQSATNVTIMLKNGPAPTIIQSVLFNGTAPASFQWQGGTPPTGNANATDVYSFTVYDDGFGVNVLGQMVSFA